MNKSNTESVQDPWGTAWLYARLPGGYHKASCKLLIYIEQWIAIKYGISLKIDPPLPPFIFFMWFLTWL